MKFKVGDRVRCIGKEGRGAGWKEGYEFVIDHITGYTDDPIAWPKDEHGVFFSELELAMEHKHKFKVGDRVVASDYACPKNIIGVIKGTIMIPETWYAVEFEGWDRGHDCNYRQVKFHLGRTGYFLREEHLTLAPKTKQEKFTPPFYVDCPTEEIWNKVFKKMEGMGAYCAFKSSFKDGFHILDLDDRVSTGPRIFCWDIKSRAQDSTPISYQEFLGEEKEEEKITFTYTSPKYTMPKPFGYKVLATEFNPFYKFSHSLMETLKSIPDRLKRALNPALQACYKLGWIDGDLDVTEDGRDALLDFLFDKHEAEMGAVAKAKIKELKKKKKDDGEE